VQVQALSPRLLGGEVSPRPNAAVAVWRRERGQWRVVAHPILDDQGAFRTPLPLRAVDYKVTVAGDGRLAATHTTLHVTRRLLLSLRP
jgi:ketosteroid isomerase-like protein